MQESNHLSKGLFITFEGGEGSGKTTVQQKLLTHLQSKGFASVSTRAPGGTPLGLSIRELLLHQKNQFLSKKAELFLFLADRAQHVAELILPALQEKKIVLCDRFNDSTLAYQGAARYGNLEFIELLCSYVTESLIPDLTFYLDVDPIVGLKRARQAIVKQGKADYDRLENEALEFHQRVRESYLHIAQKHPKRFVVIDTHRPIEEVYEIALSSIKHLIKESS
jgi:dTMP kinase